MDSQRPQTSIFAVIKGILMIFGIGSNDLPHKPGPLDSYVRVAVGLNGDEGLPGSLRHAAGNAPLINAFNENQNYCGSSNHKFPYITSGAFLDINVFQARDGPGEQATSLQIIPTKNELCIAYITQTWADGTHRGWLGDMGRGCGKDWYYSNVLVGNDHKPTCAWVDNDHSHGITTAALQIHMQDFTNLTSDYNHDPRFYCTWPTMLWQADVPDYRVSEHKIKNPSPWTGPVDFDWKPYFWDDSDTAGTTDHEMNDGTGGKEETTGGSRLKKRSGLAAFSHLIASPHDRHSAKELCESESSHGPDFISSSEGIFCDMDTKTHWPLCDRTTEKECYHWDTHSLVLGDERQPRNYSHVETWE